MKKLVLLLPLAALLPGCQKEYQCTQVITKHINGVEIDKEQHNIYSDHCITSSCFNYEQTINDTLIVCKTTCK